MIDLFCNGDDDSSASKEKQFGDISFKKNPVQNQSDTLIANALKQMSLKERERVIHEMHGVADVVDEEPGFMAQCLQELLEELVNLKSNSNLPSAAINLAELTDPGFVNNPKFLLKFLRADRNDPRKAAGRMIRYFDWKLSLFGESKLCKDITFDDLDEDDVKTLKQGYLQILPSRDRAGREIRFYVTKNQRYKSPESLVSRNVTAGVLGV
jgi:hypothetical protein